MLSNYFFFFFLSQCFQKSSAADVLKSISKGKKVNNVLVCIIQIIIQGMVGSGSHGNIAIDDISLTPGCEVGGKIIKQFLMSYFIII